MRWFEPDGFLDLAESLRIQRATAVPAMLQLLLGNMGRPGGGIMAHPAGPA